MEKLFGAIKKPSKPDSSEPGEGEEDEEEI